MRLLAAAAAATAVAALQWNSVAIGGGGYVTGIVVSAPSTDAANTAVYFRTDVGGAYRLANNGTAWKPLNEQFSYRDKNLYGVSALAVSPLDSLHVFAAFGGYLDQQPSGIFESHDGGDSWTKITPDGWPVPIGGNDYTHVERATGERLAVHPTDPSIVLFASETAGLWSTRDGGATWQQAPCDVIPCANTTGAEDGVSLVTFDPAHPDTVLALLYGVTWLVSTDAGVSWAPMAGSPPQARRCAWAVDAGAAGDPYTPLWCAAQDGVWSMSSAGTWAAVPTPAGAVPMYGLDVNPWDAQDIIAMPYYTGSPPQKLVRSVDGGKTWFTLLPPVSNNTLPWDTIHNTDLSKGNAAANVKFDPRPVPAGSKAGRVWVGNWYSMWYCDNLDASTATPPSPTVWTNLMPGHEEVFVLSMAAPPAGPLLLTGTADLGGFQHPGPSLSAYPRLSFMTVDGGEGTGSDYTEGVTTAPCNSWGSSNSSSSGEVAAGPVPALLVRTQFVPWQGNGSGVVSTSCNGGNDWLPTRWPAAAIPLRVAVAAYDPTSMVVLVQQGQAMVTGDGGATWRPVQGLPPFNYVPLSGNRYNHSSPLTSDRTLIAGAGSAAGPSTFYYHDCPTGTLYRSTDSGQTFAPLPVQGGSGTPVPPPGPRCQLLSAPVQAGQPGAGSLWLAAGDAGLWTGSISAGGQVTWQQVGSVTAAHAIAFGAPPPPPASAYPVLYLYGTTSVGPAGADYAPWASLGPAWGAAWTSLSSPTQGLGDWTEVMAASRQQYGLVMLGSFGRGAYWADASGVLPTAAAAS